VSVRELDPSFFGHLDLPKSVHGVIVSRVDPTGAAFSSPIRRGFVIMEINRHPVPTVSEYLRIVTAAKRGDVLALYYYDPSLAQRALLTVTVE
jgi:S1-C subfamily serine protease